jgi:hypothetical protein
MTVYMPLVCASCFMLARCAAVAAVITAMIVCVHIHVYTYVYAHGKSAQVIILQQYHCAIVAAVVAAMIRKSLNADYHLHHNTSCSCGDPC